MKPTPGEAALTKFCDVTGMGAGSFAKIELWDAIANAAIHAFAGGRTAAELLRFHQAENDRLRARVQELEEQSIALVSFAALHPDNPDDSPMYEQAQRLRAVVEEKS